MKLLDLFCGAGGAARGYADAGFEQIVGIDHKPQRHYPYQFVQADALEYLAKYGREFDVIHSSPPCQAYSTLRRAIQPQRDYPDLLGPTRNTLIMTGKPWIIENVRGAPLLQPVMLCGTMFGLRLFRHRYFETSMFLLGPPHQSHRALGLRAPRTSRVPGPGEVWSIYGHFSGVKEAGIAMGIDWMNRAELAQAIPPAYTEWIGRRILEQGDKSNG